ncbi:hypothetical protein [Larkinella rosea]|nr:hypothetical protein [Larkinella rosea]
MSSFLKSWIKPECSRGVSLANRRYSRDKPYVYSGRFWFGLPISKI